MITVRGIVMCAALLGVMLAACKVPGFIQYTGAEFIIEAAASD